LSDLGHTVEEAGPAIDAESMVKSFMGLWSAGCAWTIDGLAHVTRRAPSEEDFEPLTWALYGMGSKRTASEYLLALQMLQSVGRGIGHFFEDYDVWLTPTLGEPPVTLGTFDATPENPLQGMIRATAFVPFTPICNITGQPAMSVPLFWNAEGLPVGTHFVARFGDEATLFRLAAQLEAARPWANRRPPIA